MYQDHQVRQTPVQQEQQTKGRQYQDHQVLPQTQEHQPDHHHISREAVLQDRLHPIQRRRVHLPTTTEEQLLREAAVHHTEAAAVQAVAVHLIQAEAVAAVQEAAEAEVRAAVAAAAEVQEAAVVAAAVAEDDS